MLSRMTAGAARHIADRLAAGHAARVFGGQQMTATGIEVRAFTEELAPRSPASSETSTCPWPSRQRTCRPFRKTLAARLNVDVKVLERFDPRQYIGPFFRCFDVWLPEWSLILDVPDITFRVTQDVNNDSTQDDLRRGASSMCVGRRPLPNTTLYAWGNALVSHTCSVPEVPCGNQPAILYAGLMPLTNPPGPVDPYHDAAVGYAKRDKSAAPVGRSRRAAPKPLASTPFSRTLQLYGCVELLRPCSTGFSTA